METMTKAGVTYTYNKYEISKIINETIDKIQKWADENNYRVDGNLDIYKDLDSKWTNLSKRQMKKIQRYCFWINRKPSFKRVNTFLNLLSRYFELGEKVHIKISLKEETIQKARKEWVKARDEADGLLKLYKDEKGDFYK